MHEALPAYAFEALKLGKRIGVVVDAQIEIRPFLLAANDESGGLLAATLAMLLLPKLWGFVLLVRDRRRSAEFGGKTKVAAGVLLETAGTLSLDFRQHPGLYARRVPLPLLCNLHHLFGHR